MYRVSRHVVAKPRGWKLTARPPQEIAAQQRHCERARQPLQQAECCERENQGIAHRPEQHVDRSIKFPLPLPAARTCNHRGEVPRRISAPTADRCARWTAEAFGPSLQSLCSSDIVAPPARQAVRQLARHGYGDEIQGAPSSHLSAVAEVEILCQCITMPSTRSLDRGSPPNAAGAIEWQDLTRPTSRRLLHGEMALENDLLRMCHAVFSGIQKVASGLHKGETRISEQRPKTQSQEIGRRDIIRFEHCDKRLVGERVRPSAPRL